MALSFVNIGIFCHCQNHHSVGLQPLLPQNCLHCHVDVYSEVLDEARHVTWGVINQQYGFFLCHHWHLLSLSKSPFCWPPTSITTKPSPLPCRCIFWSTWWGSTCDLRCHKPTVWLLPLSPPASSVTVKITICWPPTSITTKLPPLQHNTTFSTAKESLSLSLSLSLPTQPTPYLGYVIILFHSSVLSCSVPTHSPLPHKTTLFLLFLPLNSDILCWKSWLCCSPLCSSVILWIVLGVMLPCAKIQNFKLQNLISNHSYFLQQLLVCTRNYNNWTKSDWLETMEDIGLVGRMRYRGR